MQEPYVILHNIKYYIHMLFFHIKNRNVVYIFFCLNCRCIMITGIIVQVDTVGSPGLTSVK